METPFPAYKGDEPYVFVSYAHDDSSRVYPEITRLRDQGFNIWYDEGSTMEPFNGGTGSSICRAKSTFAPLQST